MPKLEGDLFSVLILIGTACTNTQLTPTPPIDPTTSWEITLSGINERQTPNFGAVEGQTLDGETVRIDITLIYRIDSEQVNHIYEQWGLDYPTELLLPMLRTTTEQIISQYSACDLYREKRFGFEETLRSALETQLLEAGFIFQNAFIRDMQFTNEFVTQVEQEIIATMTAEAQLPLITSTP